MTEYRASFDAEVTFLNGGGLQAQGFRLDVPGDEITEHELAELFVRHLGLLMVDRVQQHDIQVFAEPHKGSRGGPADLPARSERTRRVVELSHQIVAGTTTYPGLPGPEITRYLSRAESRKHYATSQLVADHLAADPRVDHVAYPGLADHPQHHVAAAQLRGGFGGVVSFAVAGTHEDRVRFVNDLRVITSAVSLGHDETLIAYEEYPEARAAAFDPVFREHGLIRLAIGLESAEDLIADLDAALTTAYGSAD